MIVRYPNGQSPKSSRIESTVTIMQFWNVPKWKIPLPLADVEKFTRWTVWLNVAGMREKGSDLGTRQIQREAEVI